MHKINQDMYNIFFIGHLHSNKLHQTHVGLPGDCTTPYTVNYHVLEDTVVDDQPSKCQDTNSSSA